MTTTVRMPFVAVLVLALTTLIPRVTERPIAHRTSPSPSSAVSTGRGTALGSVHDRQYGSACFRQRETTRAKDAFALGIAIRHCFCTDCTVNTAVRLWCTLYCTILR